MTVRGNCALSTAIYRTVRTVLGVVAARWGKKLDETPALTAVDIDKGHSYTESSWNQDIL